MPGGATGGSGGGYNYVQDAEPSDAEEGEEWYDTGANRAYVYDGASWIEQTVVDHGQLSGVNAADHHARPTPGNALADNAGAFDVQEGNIDYSNLSGKPTSTGQKSGGKFWTGGWSDAGGNNYSVAVDGIVADRIRYTLQVNYENRQYEVRVKGPTGTVIDSWQTATLATGTHSYEHGFSADYVAEIQALNITDNYKFDLNSAELRYAGFSQHTHSL